MTFREFIKENRSKIANTENPKLVARDLYLVTLGFKIREREIIKNKFWSQFIRR